MPLYLLQIGIHTYNINEFRQILTCFKMINEYMRIPHDLTISLRLA